MIGQVMIPAAVAAATSLICCKISAAHTLDVIDGYVKEMIELAKKSIRDADISEDHPQTEPGTRKESETEKPYSITKQFADSPMISPDADNGLVQAEISIVLKTFDWYKFQSQPFYQQLIEYLDNVETQ